MGFLRREIYIFADIVSTSATHLNTSKYICESYFFGWLSVAESGFNWFVQ